MLFKRLCVFLVLQQRLFAWVYLDRSAPRTPLTAKRKSGESFNEREERLAMKSWQKQEAKKRKKDDNKGVMRKVRSRQKTTIQPPAKKAAPAKRLKRRLASDELQPASFIGSYDDITELPFMPIPEIAFLGRSNVGKSSLLNALLAGRKPIAVVGQRPGRTRRINLFRVRDKKNAECIFADLPGYGFAKLSKLEKESISNFVMDYLDARPQLRLIIFIVDARREPNHEDVQLLDRLRRVNGLDTIVIATKIDKLASGEILLESLNALNLAFNLPPDQPLYFSALTRQGRSDLWSAINDHIGPRSSTNLQQEEPQSHTTSATELDLLTDLDLLLSHDDSTEDDESYYAYEPKEAEYNDLQAPTSSSSSSQPRSRSSAGNQEDLQVASIISTAAANGDDHDGNDDQKEDDDDDDMLLSF